MRRQGVQLATMRKLARYWETKHDWRVAEARLNSYPQFVTEIGVGGAAALREGGARGVQIVAVAREQYRVTQENGTEEDVR